MVNAAFLRISRYSETSDGTFGVMTINGEPFCLTLEPNDRGNEKNSCIPAGVYRCRRHSGPRFKNSWEVAGVPNRSAIIFHIGNIEDDTVGCILLGKSLFTLKRKLGVSTSSQTFSRFMAITKTAHDLHLTITENF